MNKLNINVVYTDPYLEKKYGGLKYARPDDAGVDLRACFQHANSSHGAYRILGPAGEGPVLCDILPGQTKTFSAGFKMEVPEGYMAALHPRGGTGTKGLVLGNLTGVIDLGYQGEVFINLWNRTQDTIIIEAYDRVAQMVIVPIAQATFQKVEAFAAETDRGEGKLGSSGKA